ncbi:pyruvate kinase [Candidatus Saccharibacteria bacterium]|nr:pyruvate kinase [Candidatus Saccharibacteria bacterium]MCL1962713.1 pyruvate kinase [Candidatus Saccharibacteria bacterium]
MATIGPATWSEVDGDKKIEEIMKAGVDIYRLNFSHGSYEEKAAQIRDIRMAADRLGRRVAIVQDLQGPKIRLGDVKDNSLFVKTGDELILDYALKDVEHDGSFNIPLQYNLAEKVKIGEIAYIFDGKIKTEIIEIPTKTAIKVKVLNDGEIQRKKGINLPDTDFGDDVFPQKDLDDMEWAADKGFDFVAFSFIQSAENIRQGKELLKKYGYPDEIKVIAKIETKPSTKDEETMEDIARTANVILIARGDMAYEVGMEQIPTIQRKLTRICRRLGRPVIVATQTMGSMVDSPVPTRAEADNVATSIIRGVDVIMLSEETAVGKYPVETVAALKKIIIFTQNHNVVNTASWLPMVERYEQPDLLCKAAVQLAEDMDVNFMITETQTSWTTIATSANRPARRIISVTDNPILANQMVILYGVDSYVRPYERNYGQKLAEELKRDGRILIGKDEGTAIVVSGRFDTAVRTYSDTIQFRTIK